MSLPCAFPQVLWLSPSSHRDVVFYLPPHHCCSVLFAMENEFDLEEIKVAWDFQRKLGNLGMSRAFWNRQWFGLSQRK